MKKNMFVLFAGLVVLSSSGCTLQREPESQGEATLTEETPAEPQAGTAQGALVCRGIVVCINHVLWCEPSMPNGGDPTRIGTAEISCMWSCA